MQTINQHYITIRSALGSRARIKEKITGHLAYVRGSLGGGGEERKNIWDMTDVEGERPE